MLRERAGGFVNLGKRLAIELFVATGIGAVLGLFGPFGTYGFGLGLRMAYWIGFIIIGFLIFRPLIVVGGWLTEQTGMARGMARGLALALASLPMTLMVSWMLNGFRLGWPTNQGELAVLYAQVLLIGVLVNWLFHGVFGDGTAPDEANVKPPPEAPEPVDTKAEPAFFARLPAGFGPLLALGGEDHYVRAYAKGRDTLILIRLRDAIAELEGVDGVQVHRSWWVARDAIAGQERDGRNVRLILAGGQKVPVSRDGVKLLAETGWI